MRWLIWALIAFFFYSFMPPLVKMATKEIPSYIAVTVTNSILALFAFTVAKIQGYSIVENIGLNKPSLALYGAGIALAVSIISYYNALELGPISSVVPIYGMNIALSSIIGILLLGEKMTATKGIGLVFAVLAIIFLSR